MTEKQLEQKLVQAVKNNGGIAYKFVSPGHVGVPDRLIILPGNKIAFVEVKSPGKGKLSKLQEYELDRLFAFGCKCYVLDDPGFIVEILRDLEDKR